MVLYEEYFKTIKEGIKIVEVRLNGVKRRKIKVGDTIEFIKVPENDEAMQVKVTELRTYDTFKAMYESTPFKEFDCEDWTMEEMIEGTYDIYTPKQKKEWETLASTIKYMG